VLSWLAETRNLSSNGRRICLSGWSRLTLEDGAVYLLFIRCSFPAARVAQVSIEADVYALITKTHGFNQAVNERIISESLSVSHSAWTEQQFVQHGETLHIVPFLNVGATNPMSITPGLLITR
jgi:hypothetical protein